jgi:hypothetical protein
MVGNSEKKKREMKASKIAPPLVSHNRHIKKLKARSIHAMQPTKRKVEVHGKKTISPTKQNAYTSR